MNHELFKLEREQTLFEVKKSDEKFLTLRSFYAKARVSLIVTLILLLILFTAVRIGRAQPSATTLAASNITATSATLNGKVVTNGQDTYWLFGYYQGNSFLGWCPAPPGNIVSGANSEMPVNCPINGLQPSITYSFFLEDGWAGGPTQKAGLVDFPTLAGAASSGPGAETDAATDITATFAVLHGIVTTNGKDTLWVFAYDQGYSKPSGNNRCPAGDSSNWGYVPAGVGTQPASCQVTGLQPSTTYSFVLADCWASACASVYGSTLTFTTLAPGAPFDFTLSASPSTVSVKQGDTAHYAVSVMYSDPSYAGTMINIQLTGLGPGMDYQLSQSGDLTITTSQTTPTGSYSIVLTGSANGVTHQTGFTLIVTSAQPSTTAITSTTVPSTSTSSVAFDYSVSVSPSTESVEVGGSTSYVVSVLPLAGSPVPVSLDVMGLPDEVRHGFTIQSGTPPYTSTLDVDLSPPVNAGTYTLTILATTGGNVKSATATLIVEEKAAQTQTTIAQTATGGSGWSDVLQQNLLPLLVLFAVVVAVLGFRLGRRGRGQTALAQQVDASRTFCGKCGAENPASNEFCGSCGNRLKSS